MSTPSCPFSWTKSYLLEADSCWKTRCSLDYVFCVPMQQQCNCYFLFFFPPFTEKRNAPLGKKTSSRRIVCYTRLEFPWWQSKPLLCSVLSWCCDVIWLIFINIWRLCWHRGHSSCPWSGQQVLHQPSCDNALGYFQIRSWFTAPHRWTVHTWCTKSTNHTSGKYFALCWKRSKVKGSCLPFLPTVISCGRSSMVIKEETLTHWEEVKCKMANSHPKHSSCISLVGMVILLMSFLQQPSLKPKRTIIFQII